MTHQNHQLHIALLRGVNVGGKNKLPMANLRIAFESCGATNVQSYIQSGNVIFRAEPDAADSLVAQVRQQIEHEFGLVVPVICRSLPQMKAVFHSNPFLARGEDPGKLHVGFLADEPQANNVAALDPERSPPDEFVVVGSHVYLLLPNGTARSKLTNAYFDSRLGTTTTIRNWRTIGKLLQLAEAA